VCRELADTPDHHAVLVLQPTVEAFFLGITHTRLTLSLFVLKPIGCESIGFEPIGYEPIGYEPIGFDLVGHLGSRIQG
jgi:hypothetical protein